MSQVITSASVVTDFSNVQKKPDELIVLRSFKEGEVIVPSCKILRIHAAKAYSTFYFTDGNTFFSSRNLNYHAKDLDDNYFIRVHKSHIVNMLEVKSILKARVKKVILSDGTSIEMSRRKAPIVIAIFEKLNAEKN